MGDLGEITGMVVEKVVHLTPWFLLAILVSGVVQAMSLEDAARRAFTKRGRSAIVFTTALGAFSPLCSCTVIPLIHTFLRSGVPLSAVMAFWIASPTMDPELFALTAAQLGMPVAVARLLGSLGMSLAAGYLVYAFERRGMLLDPLRRSRSEAKAATSTSAPVAVPATGTGGPALADADGATGCCGSAPSAEPATPAPKPRWYGLLDIKPGNLLRIMAADTRKLAPWLLIAIVLQALMALYLPQEPILNTLGADNIFAIPLAAAVGMPLYLNGVSALPIVAGLIDKGMQPAAAVAFLLAGAVATLPAIAAVRGVVRNNIVGLYLAIGFVGSVLVGLVSSIWL